ncbi:BnaC03g13850D [Brassica napus]|uniref:BnaC03g13850D protein n=1 Tax=Brassica napus TaxID=3708 RepID=A0A078FG66_BRANA|nr:BnaC03g13850D [Brassica napus]
MLRINNLLRFPKIKSKPYESSQRKISIRSDHRFPAHRSSS